MNSKRNSAKDYIEIFEKKVPEYLDLLVSETDETFDAAFDMLLEKSLSHLEKNKKNFQTLDEEGLSAVLAGTMTIPWLTVSQEKHSGGHVDLTFEAVHCKPSRTMLGEAKIYKGYKYHEGGLEQLLSRYITGREKRSFLIAYVRERNIKGLVEKLKKRMDDELPCAQIGQTENHQVKWSFHSIHKHSSGEDMKICHVGCNLHID